MQVFLTRTNLIVRIRHVRCTRSRSFPVCVDKKNHDHSVGLVQMYKGGGSGASPAAGCNANKYPVVEDGPVLYAVPRLEPEEGNSPASPPAAAAAAAIHLPRAEVERCPG